MTYLLLERVLADELCVGAEIGRGQTRLDQLGQHQRHADFARHRFGEPVRALGEVLGNASEVAGAILDAQLGARLEGFARGGTARYPAPAFSPPSRE